MRLDNVFNDDNPLKPVRQVHQGFLLLLAFFGGRYFKGGLNVESLAPFVCHKVDFVILPFWLALDFDLPFHDPHIHAVAPVTQFVVYDVLHHMIFFHLPKI